jgi:hypothetical protein
MDGRDCIPGRGLRDFEMQPFDGAFMITPLPFISIWEKEILSETSLAETDL